MKYIFTLMFSLLLSGCGGLAVGTYGTFEQDRESFSISDQKNVFAFETESEHPNKQQLIDKWGKPDAISQLGKCEVLTYHDGYSWSGVGAFVLFLPIPLMVPSGYDETHFYFINNKAVRAVSEYGEVTNGFGYMCGSNECSWLTGKVNTDETRKVNVTWCN
jgi:hypothetical protein